MLKETIRNADWKTEKHVPVIEILENHEGKMKISVMVGKEISHPNTAEHHIAWIELYLMPEKTQFPILVGRVNFTAHSAPITEPSAIFNVICKRKGKLMALSYCNIHGLWENELEF